MVAKLTKLPYTRQNSEKKETLTMQIWSEKRSRDSTHTEAVLKAK